MLRAFVYGSVLFATALAATGCAGSSTPLTSTNPSTATPITEPPFTGTLTVNGAKLQPFIVTASGTVTATIATLDKNPDGTGATVDLGLGTWNGLQCSLGIVVPAAVEGSSVSGAAAGAGSLCVRIGDDGNLVAPVAFTINIVHF